jgi:hypothetical protein
MPALFIFRSVDRIRPKGFAAAVQIYELVGGKSGKCGIDTAEAWAGAEVALVPK